MAVNYIKSFALLLLVSLFVLSYGYLVNMLGIDKAALISAIVTFNPISVSQLYSNYVDGSMGVLLIILLLYMTMLLKIDRQDKTARWITTCSAVFAASLAINLKFTGLVHVLIVFACYGMYVLLKKDSRRILEFGAIGLLTVMLGLGVIGATSYGKNLATHGNPFYPLLGKGSVNFIKAEEPIGFEDDSDLKKFIKSNLSATTQVNRNISKEVGPPKIKPPFSISPKEIETLRYVDVRQGGYGVWFGGALLVAVFGSMYLAFTYRLKSRKISPELVLPCLPIILAIFFVDATWWARYLPHLIVFPVLVVVASYLLRKRGLGNVLVFCLLFNTILTACISFHYQIEAQENFSSRLKASLACNGKKK